MNPNHLALFNPELALIPDQATGETINLRNLGFAMMLCDGTGGKTLKLPDGSGWQCILTNTAAAGDVTVTDADGDATGVVNADESCLFVRTGSTAAGMKWKCVLLKSGVT